MSAAQGLENPILNSPYNPPEQHFVIGPYGPTGEVKVGRRPSESFIPVPVGRRRQGSVYSAAADQEELDFDVTGERREVNSLINDIRVRVDRWRSLDYPGVTPVTRKLLQHWADPGREDRVLFCQREGAETVIYLAEAAGRRGEPDFRIRVNTENRTHNDGLTRVGLKMATGTGKTIVMAMLIAWQTANKAFSPRDARFTNRFLVITQCHSGTSLPRPASTPRPPTPAPDAATGKTPTWPSPPPTRCTTRAGRPTTAAALPHVDSL